MAYSCIYPSGYTLSLTEQARYPSSKRFTSMSGWEAQNLSLSEDEICEIIGGDAAYNWSTAGADTSAVNIDGWTPNGYRIILRTVGSARHVSVWDDTKYRLSIDGESSLTINVESVTIDGLQISNGMTSTYDPGINCNTGNCTICNNIVRGTGSSNYCSGMEIAIPTGTVCNIYNNIVYGWTRYGIQGSNDGGDNDSLFCYNNTIYGTGAAGISSGYKDVVVKNCIIEDCGGTIAGTESNYSTNNLENPGTIVFADESNDDFHLDSTDTTAKGNGVDLSTDSDGFLSFATDIDGDARSAWDIGADEYVAAGGTERNLIANIAAASTTPPAAATVLRSLLSDIAGASLTPNISASLSSIIDLVASIQGDSATPDVSAYLLRSLITAIGNSSTTAEAEVSISRALIANLAGVSSTPGVQATIERMLVAQIVGGSTTSDISAQTVRDLVAAVIGASVTPDIAATIQGIISFSAGISGISTTPEIASVTARELSANIQIASVTSDVVAALVRSLSASISGDSGTPEITVSLANIVSFVAAVQGVGATPEISANIARTLVAAITGQGATPGIQATTVRQLMAAIDGTSLTPDDLVLIMAGLGVIVDPSIDYLTVQRTITSLTMRRSIHTI